MIEFEGKYICTVNEKGSQVMFRNNKLEKPISSRQSAGFDFTNIWAAFDLTKCGFRDMGFPIECREHDRHAASLEQEHNLTQRVS